MSVWAWQANRGMTGGAARTLTATGGRTQMRIGPCPMALTLIPDISGQFRDIDSDGYGDNACPQCGRMRLHARDLKRQGRLHRH